MQVGRTTRWILASIAALTLAAVLSAEWFAARVPAAPCGQAQPNDHALSPIEVVAKPWYGPHHVYALFQLPDRFEVGHHMTTMSVAGYRASVDLGSIRRGSPEARSVSPSGRYVKRLYLPTRTAVGFLVAGRFADLRARCNWTLEIPE